MAYTFVAKFHPEIRDGCYYVFEQDVSELVPFGVSPTEIDCKIYRSGSSYAVTLAYSALRSEPERNVTYLFSQDKLATYCRVLEEIGSRPALTALGPRIISAVAAPPAPVTSYILPFTDGSVFSDRDFDISVTRGSLYLNGTLIRNNVAGLMLTINHAEKKFYVDGALEAQAINGVLHFYSPERAKRVSIFERLFAMRDYLDLRRLEGEDRNFINRFNHFVRIIVAMLSEAAIPELDPVITRGLFIGWRTQRYRNLYVDLVNDIRGGVPFLLFAPTESLRHVAQEFMDNLQTEAAAGSPPSRYAVINEMLQTAINRALEERAARAQTVFRGDYGHAFDPEMSTGLLSAGIEGR